MTYRLLLWFDMLEEEGRSTTIRGLFSRIPPVSKDLSKGNIRRKDGDGIGGIGGSCGDGSGNGNGNGNGFGYNSGRLFNNYPEIIVIKI